MDVFEVVEKFVSPVDAYEVMVGGQDAPVYVVKGRITLRPSLTMTKPDGTDVATLTGDVLNLRYALATADGKHTATMTFPFGFKKAFTMKVGNDEYKATGEMFERTFDCTGPDGKLAMHIERRGHLTPTRFRVEVHAPVPGELVPLVAVAIHQCYR